MSTFSTGFSPLHLVSCPNPDRTYIYIYIYIYIFISSMYLIPNDWKQINTWMRLHFHFHFKFIFELETFSYIRMGLSLAKQLISPEKMFSILVFVSPICTPLIPCHHYWNRWQPWLQRHTEKWRADSPAEHDDDKWVRGETIFLIFRWKIILHDSYQSDVTVLKIKELEQKVLGDRVKDCSRVLLSVLETSHQLYFKETALYES